MRFSVSPAGATAGPAYLEAAAQAWRACGQKPWAAELDGRAGVGT